MSSSNADLNIPELVEANYRAVEYRLAWGQLIDGLVGILVQDGKIRNAHNNPEVKAMHRLVPEVRNGRANRERVPYINLSAGEGQLRDDKRRLP